jgi:hypothetical protein
MRNRQLIAILAAATALLCSRAAIAQMPQPLPSPWQSVDIGDVGTAGSAFTGPDGDLFVAGAGSDIWDTSDSFRFVYRPIRDGFITAHVTSQTNTDPFAKTGVMIRQSLDPSSPELILDVKPDGGLELMLRSSSGGQTTFIRGGSVPITIGADGQVDMDVILSLSRSGNAVIATICVQSPDGNVTCSGPANVSFPSGPALIGIAVTSHDPSRLNHAHLSTMPTVSAVPAPWLATDVGDVGLPGFATWEAASGTFFVSGAGSDIWNTEDSFHAVTQSLNGDTTLTARVVSMQNTDQFAKAGIEIGDVSPDAARVILDVKPDGGIEFMARTESGAAMSFLAGAQVSFPVWLRLVRSGDFFVGLISSDGQIWMQVGSLTMTLPTTVRQGLAVTSHDSAVRNTAVFDNVSVTQSPVPTGNLLQNPGFEESLVPNMEPGWVSDNGRQAPAHTATATPHTGSTYGVCETTAESDCGIYQDFTLPANGFYVFSAYVAADKPGALLGVNINGVARVTQVATGGYTRYTVLLTAGIGTSIRVWLYSPASRGTVLIDDASFVRDTGPH